MVYSAKQNHGQALISLLYIIIITVTISTMAIVMLVNTSLSSSQIEEGSSTYSIAQSGIENALLRLLRDPNYTGDTFTVGDGSVSVQVTQGSPITIISTGKKRNFIRKIEVKTMYNNNKYDIVSWKEIN